MSISSSKSYPVVFNLSKTGKKLLGIPLKPVCVSFILTPENNLKITFVSLFPNLLLKGISLLSNTAGIYDDTFIYRKLVFQGVDLDDNLCNS